MLHIITQKTDFNFCVYTFTHVNMYNIDTIQLQSSHEQYSKCVVLLSNVFVQYFVADIQSDCHADPPETYALGFLLHRVTVSCLTYLFMPCCYFSI